MTNNNEIPRRNRLDLNTPAEIAIYNAMQEVEKVGADVRLTEVVTLLAKAKNILSNYVDGEPKSILGTISLLDEKWVNGNTTFPEAIQGELEMLDEYAPEVILDSIRLLTEQALDRQERRLGLLNS